MNFVSTQEVAVPMQQPPGVPPGVALSLAIAASVVTYVGCVRRMQLRDADFAACSLALALALYLALCPMLAQDLVQRLAEKFARREGFLDNALTITHDLLTPTLDRLVLGISGKKADGTSVFTPSLQMVDITPDRFPGTSADDAAALQLEYKRIAFMLCRMSESFPDRYDAMMMALSAPPPVYEPARPPRRVIKRTHKRPASSTNPATNAVATSGDADGGAYA
jgi:hypothetical protein